MIDAAKLVEIQRIKKEEQKAASAKPPAPVSSGKTFPLAGNQIK